MKRKIVDKLIRSVVKKPLLELNGIYFQDELEKMEDSTFRQLKKLGRKTPFFLGGDTCEIVEFHYKLLCDYANDLALETSFCHKMFGKEHEGDDMRKFLFIFKKQARHFCKYYGLDSSPFDDKRFWRKYAVIK